MPNFRKTFELGDFKNRSEVPFEELNTPFKKETYKKGPLDKEKNREDDPMQELSQKDYDEIIELLRSKKRGGADIHLSQINIAKLGETELGKEALRLFKLHIEDKLGEEEIRGLLADAKEGSNEYNFGAMLLNWSLDKTEIKKAAEREMLKREAEEKMKNDPHISAKIEGIDLFFLRKPEWEVTTGKRSFESYEEKLLAYLKSQKEEGRAIESLKTDPRFQYYCVMQKVINNKSITPENFLGNLYNN